MKRLVREDEEGNSIFTSVDRYSWFLYLFDKWSKRNVFTSFPLSLDEWYAISRIAWIRMKGYQRKRRPYVYRCLVIIGKHRECEYKSRDKFCSRLSSLQFDSWLRQHDRWMKVVWKIGNWITIKSEETSLRGWDADVDEFRYFSFIFTSWPNICNRFL